MITLLIILIAISIASYLTYDAYSEDGVFSAVVACFLSGLCAFGFFVTVLMLGEASVPKKEISRKDFSRPIYSLNNTDIQSGNFFLGSGSIDSREYYRTFIKTDRGGYCRFEVAVNKAELYLNDEQSPRLTWQEIKYVLPWWFSFWEISTTAKTKYDIIVPSSTIIQKFEVK